MTTELGKRRVLVTCFDALGRYTHIERLRQCNDRTHDGLVGLRRRHVAHKGAIDLEFGEWQLSQVLQ